MILENYKNEQRWKDFATNARESVQNLVPEDLGIDFAKSWLLTEKGGNNVVEFQTILSVDFIDESNVVSSVIEEGSFVSYNKVALPVQIVMTVVLDGTKTIQQKSLETLRELKNTTRLLQVITPFEAYPDMNLTALRYSRTTERGSTQTVVDLVLQEVRQTVVQVAKSNRMTKASSVKNASSVSKATTGKVEVKTVSSNDGLLKKAMGFIGMDA